MYHYTYRITHIEDRIHYYGVRTSKIHPSKDLGIKYFSSSTNKEFIKDQKKNTQLYKYKVIRISNTREDALALEIELHNKFNVGVNESFYNKVKQMSDGFDNTGNVHSEQFKNRRRYEMLGDKNPMFGKKHPDEIIDKIKNNRSSTTGKNHHMFGKHHSDETKNKISNSHKGKKHGKRTIETRNKISKSLKGKPKSEEHKRKQSEKMSGANHPNYGIKLSDDTKKKMREYHKNLPNVKCPHCDKEGKLSSAMKRYHFNNCKFKN